MKTIGIYTASWVGMVFVAILNGAIREKGYGPFMNELSAHQLSTASGIGLFGIYIWLLTGIRPIESSGRAIVIGVIWLFMTIGFEFIFGHYVVGHPWQRLFQDYNLFQGRVWVLVLIWTAIAPYFFSLLSG